MSFFPELLYQLSARDQQVTWLDPLVANANVSAAQASVGANAYTVPEGQALLLQSAAAFFNPGAAQFITAASVLLRPKGTTGASDRNLAAGGFVGTADQNEALNWSGSVIVPPGWSIQASGTFNAGVAANQTTLDVIGLLIPIGNIQRI